MNDQQDRGALWQALFTRRNFAPEDIGPLMDTPPNEVMIRLNKALFEPLQAMVGFADLWHVEVDLRAVQQVCGVPARDLRDAVGRSVTALHTQARRATDEYWSTHLGSLNELVPGSDLGPDSGANEQAAPRDFEREREILAAWQALRPGCERVLALIRPVHECLAREAAWDEDIMQILQGMAMLIRSGQRVLRALDVAAAFGQWYRS